MGIVEDNTTYYWKVVASDTGAGVSNIQTFTINIQMIHWTVTLIAPTRKYPNRH